MPSPMPIGEFRRKVQRLGIEIRKGKGSHEKLVRVDNDVKRMYLHIPGAAGL